MLVDRSATEEQLDTEAAAFTRAQRLVLGMPVMDNGEESFIQSICHIDNLRAKNAASAERKLRLPIDARPLETIRRTASDWRGYEPLAKVYAVKLCLGHRADMENIVSE